MPISSIRYRLKKTTPPVTEPAQAIEQIKPPISAGGDHIYPSDQGYNQPYYRPQSQFPPNPNRQNNWTTVPPYSQRVLRSK